MTPRHKWDRPGNQTRSHVSGTSPYDGWIIPGHYWPKEMAIEWLTSPLDYRYVREGWLVPEFDWESGVDPFGTFNNCQLLGYAELRDYSRFDGMRAWFVDHSLTDDGIAIPPVDSSHGGFTVSVDPDNFQIVAGRKSVDGYSRRDLTAANLAAAADNHRRALAAYEERRARQERAIKARSEFMNKSASGS